jgi:hypothetical protein
MEVVFMIDELKLLAGDDKVEVDGFVFKQPKLRDIKNIGLQTYYSYISFLLVSAEEYLISIKREDLIPFFKEHNLTMFDIYRDNPYERQFFIEALSFFIDGEIRFKNGMFLIDNIKIISKEDYPRILEVVGEINYLKVNKQQETFANEKARKIAEKIQQAKQKRNSLKSKDSVSLSDMISSVASRHKSLNLLNIWDLTIYQLCNQYNRLIAEDEFDIHAMNYAYYGGEFKVKHWSKSLDY